LIQFHWLVKVLAFDEWPIAEDLPVPHA